MDKDKGEILVEKKWFMDKVTQSLKEAMVGGAFEFFPADKTEGGSRFDPFFRWRFEEQMVKDSFVKELLLKALKKAAQDSGRQGFTGEYVTKDEMIKQVGRYVRREGDKKEGDKEGYLVFLCEPREGRPSARVYAIDGPVLFKDSYSVDVVEKNTETLQCLDTQALRSWDGTGSPPSEGPFWQCDENTGEVNFLGVVSLDASGLESSDACITAFAEQLYDSLITNETRKGEGGS